jgi:Mycothiol maleylpyruvate isomerase N-terminal domain
MTTEIAQWFRAELDEVRRVLMSVPARFADVPWRDGGWTRKQIVGHLLDSATNNRQRIVRAGTEGQSEGPQYDQNSWVAAHGYANQSWETLLSWWEIEHQMLMAVVDHVPEDRLDARYAVGPDAPVTLRFFIEDYVTHQRWHLKQLQAGTSA